MIHVIYDRGGGGANVPNGHIFNLFVGKMKGFYQIGFNYIIKNDMIATTSGSTTAGHTCVIYENGFSFRTTISTASTLTQSFVDIWISGNFNFDELSIVNDSTFTRRAEVRNEDGVLLCDNGLPWGDGTYPPDAKNRVGLAGLHAAPAVINPELETALMGDETNKERVHE